MDVKTLDQLPVLEQSTFPQLPEIAEGTTLLIFQSAWNNAEKEWAAGIVVTACIREGEWKPVSAPKFVEMLNNHPMATFGKQNVVNAMWELIGANQLDIVQVGDTQYLIPTPEMANIALANTNKLRVA